MHVMRWMCELSECLYISVILSTKSVYFKYIDLYMFQCKIKVYIYEWACLWAHKIVAEEVSMRGLGACVWLTSVTGSVSQLSDAIYLYPITETVGQRPCHWLAYLLCISHFMWQEGIIRAFFFCCPLVWFTQRFYILCKIKSKARE